jgi:hypothetical protein
MRPWRRVAAGTWRINAHALGTPAGVNGLAVAPHDALVAVVHQRRDDPPTLDTSGRALPAAPSSRRAAVTTHVVAGPRHRLRGSVALHFEMPTDEPRFAAPQGY